MNIFNELNLKNELCFDVGANIGTKTEKFLSIGAFVVCIEPQEYCISVLESKFVNNDKVKIIKNALGSSNETKTMFISDAHTISTLSNDFILEITKNRFKNAIWDKQQIVNILTLDDIIKDYGVPKFCKIDVEGYETEILKGLSTKIKYISIEFIPELKHKTFECIDIINKLGNYSYNYVEGESENFEFNEWIKKEEIINFLSNNNDFERSFGDLYAKLI